MPERFKEYYDTGYLVGSIGTIVSPFGRKLKQWKINSGYLCVSLLLHKLIAKTVHSLVAEMWIGSRPDGLYVNHKDGVKTNNSRKNLEYTTPSANMYHASDSLLLPRGSLHCMATITEDDAAEICQLIVDGHRNKDISEFLGISPSIIRDIRNCHSWTSVSKAYFPRPKIVSRVKLPMKTRLLLIKRIVSGEYSRKELSQDFELSPQMISDIKYHRTWSDAWEKFGEMYGKNKH